MIKIKSGNVVTAFGKHLLTTYLLTTMCLLGSQKETFSISYCLSFLSMLQNTIDCIG